MKLRRSVAAFTRLMENKLAKHDLDRGVDGWRNVPMAYLLADLRVRIRKMETRIIEWSKTRDALPDVKRTTEIAVALEAADAANYCMMIADVCKGLPEPVKLEVEDVG